MSPSPILIELPEALMGERVVVRPWRSGDGPALFDAVDESRRHILPWLPWGPSHGSPEDSEAFARKWRANWDLREDLSVAILDREGRLVGGSGLHRIDWNARIFEVGYWVRATAAGQGYVTEAVRLLCDLAFETLMANRVFIRCAVDNVASAAVAERVGFAHEGILRNGSVDANGTVHDVHVFGMIPDEWRG